MQDLYETPVMSPPLPGQLSRCEAKLASLPRVGLRFALPNRFGQLTWLGYGPQESYPDRKAGGLAWVCRERRKTARGRNECAVILIWNKAPALGDGRILLLE